VLAFLRRDGGRHVAVVLNLTPSPHPDYRIGVPSGGSWRTRLDTDAARYGGSGYAAGQDRIAAEGLPWHGQPCSLRLRLPPLAALVLAPEEP
jgi:1,4-alpha-glucan branching enzyme